jgi:hypothetical protein
MAPRKKSKAAKPAETMRQKQMRLRRETSAKKLEKGPATVLVKLLELAVPVLPPNLSLKVVALW